MSRKKKPIVQLAKGQHYISGRVLTAEMNKEIAQLAKKLKK